MFTQLRSATFLAALLFAGVANADDTIRLDGRTANTQRLDLKASDSKKDVTEQTCWIRGGYSYRPYYYGPPVVYYPPPAYMYRPVVTYYAPPPIRVYRPVVYYRAPRVIFYPPPPPPIVSYRIVSPISGTQVQTQTAEPEPQTFDYDGGPAKPVQKIPPAQLDVPAAIPNLPNLPSVPRLGPSPMELKVSAPSSGSKKSYTYPAYGEDRSPPRDDKALLIRASK